MKLKLLKTLLATAAALAVGAAHAQISDRTLRLGMQNPQGHPVEVGAQKLAELVAARSGGRMKIKVFPAGQLGGDQQTISAVQGGTVHMTILNSGILASQVKEFEVYDFPFLFASAQEADAVVDGAFGRNMHARLESKGLVGLGYWELGFRQVTNGRRPITRAEDLAGLKLRVIPNAINLEWVKAVGANPVPLAWPEVYTALETRAVDGQENPLSVIHANRLNEVQKHLALTRHVYNPQSVLIGKKMWDSFSAEEKSILADAVAEATGFERKLTREQEGVALDAIRKSGTEVSELPPAEIAKLREMVRPVIERRAEGATGEALAALKTELAKVRR